MRLTIAAALLIALSGLTAAQDKGTEVEWGGVKSTRPHGHTRRTLAPTTIPHGATRP